MKIFLVVFLIFLMLSVAFINVTDMFTVQETSTVSYIVEEGDTLWTIVKREYPDSHYGERVHEIRKMNDISPLIHPGQKIELPKKEVK